MSLEAKNRELICHYTSKETAFLILKNKKLWATDSRFLDDISEIKFLSDELYKLLEKTKSGKGFNNGMESVKKKLRYYILSFTSHKCDADKQYGNLPMGRYFGGEDWIAFVFDREKIIKKAEIAKKEFENKGINPSFLVGDVYYHDPSNIKNYENNYRGAGKFIADILEKSLSKKKFENYLIDEVLKEKKQDLIEPFITLIKEFISNSETKDKLDTYFVQNEDKCLTMLGIILNASALIKHIGFQSELEVRIALNMRCSETEGDYKVLSDLIKPDVKPHIEISFDLSDLDKIIVGPSHNQSNIYDCIYKSISMNKGNDAFPNIICSTIPWRAKHK